MIDYRSDDKELRKELFKQYYHWSMKFHDCDPALFMMNYINRRLELNIEQRYWFAWLFANTYNVATAWILFNEFPDFENVDEERLRVWNEKNYRALRYQTDNKWQKGHLYAMFLSYSSNVLEKHNSQREYFESLCNSDKYTNFVNCQNEITKKHHKFGRFLSWFYLQTLKETCDLNLEPESLLLKESSSESHRNGLMYALGLDALLDKEADFKTDSKDFIVLLDEEALELKEEMQSEFPHLQVDYFSMETVLCAFKKIFRKKNGRYLGYYLDRQAEDIWKCQGDGWLGIDWDLLWQARAETLRPDLIEDHKVDVKKMWEFLDTGTFKRFSDLK